MRLKELKTQAQEIPQYASTNGCGWEVHSVIDIPAHWQCGYYELTLTDARGTQAHHFVVVRSQKAARNLMVIATNTYQAYNYFGDYNAYANVGALMRGEMDLAEAMTEAISVVSFERPFCENIVHAPDGFPRLINLRKREYQEQPFVIDPALAELSGFSPFDGSAGFINKWEQCFVRWAEQHAIELDYAIDSDLEVSSAANDCRNILIIGHSEYWSKAQRDTVDQFVLNGGNLCVLSGNTSYWKVRHQEGRRMAVHKWKGHVNDPLWADPTTRKDATHLWSHPAFGRPETETIGLSFLYGGYHRIGNCVSRGQGGFTVADESHWTLEGSDLNYGDVFGDTLPLLGYESDGCPLQYDAKGRLVAGNAPGVPENLEVIATAPTVMMEPPRSPHAPLMPPEDMAALADIRFNAHDEESIDCARFGHAVIATFKKGKGQVFNSATTEWVHGLAANDSFVTQITQNVFVRFGVD